MSSVVKLTQSCDRLAAALKGDDGARKIIERVVVAPIHRDLDAVAVAAFGRDLTPFKNRPVRVTIRDKIEPSGTGASITFLLAPKGFWVMGQYGADPHDIDSVKEGGRLKAAGRHPVRGPIQHPGTHKNAKWAIDRAYRAIHHRRHELVAAALAEITKAAWHG